MKQKKGYVIAGGSLHHGKYSHIVWCGNGRWVDLKEGKGKVFRSKGQAYKKAEKLALNSYSSAVIHTSTISYYTGN
ncbi:hypothetical protein phi1422_0017 [Bdellovibrio phage phi1422]|uniref:hypothetical protein n=1 Tax=Bdellovibrio phage phi1422 TaxID=1127515 RepID=UPI0002536D10|nr:hypothetical protein F395_gp17 [Bdellovibrio phage phi1422]AFC22537.1 hypothetical protein phi1422_0017 [Bdellovibrio phage phi1422]